LPNEGANYVTIDPDALKGYLPEYNRMRVGQSQGAAAYAHEESSMLSKRIAAEAKDRKFNIYFDSVGDGDYDKLVRKLEGMRAEGRRVVAHYVTIDVDTALSRNITRAQKTGRYVPPDYIRETHAGVSKSFPRVLRDGLFDEATLWDSSTKEGIKVMSAVGKNVTVLDHEAWNRFLAKAQPEVGSFVSGGTQVFLARPQAVLGTQAHPNEVLDYLAQAGAREWPAAPVPAGVSMGRMGECYKNATQLAMQSSNYDFVEGIAYVPSQSPLGFQHAWVVDRTTGKVIDPTWPYRSDLRYYGVAYDKKKYMKMASRAKFYGVLGSDRAVVARVLKNGGI